MKNQELYERSVNILLDAYNDGALHHSTACACAVGNLVRANNQEHRGYLVDWHIHALSIKYPESFVKASEEGARQIKSTGYSISEVIEIETAFESKGYEDRENNTQYHGLCAVLDVLREIHEVDKESHESNHTRLETIYKKLQTA